MSKSYNNKKQVCIYISIILIAVLIYFIGYNIPLIGINKEMSSYLQENGLLTYISLITGGNLRNLTLFTLGMSPIISSAIIVQLLETELSSTVKSWRDSGKAGKKNKLILQYVITIILTYLISLGGVFAIYINTPSMLTNSLAVSSLLIPMQLSLTSCLLLALTKKIDSYLFGTGTGLFLTLGIMLTLIDTLSFSMFTSIELIITSIFFVLVSIIILVINLSSIELHGTSYLYQNINEEDKTSFKLSFSQVGVIALIYVMPIMTLLNYLMNKLVIDNELVQNLFNLANANIFTIIIYFVLIFLFSVLYTYLTLDASIMSDVLEKQGYYIFGVNPGEDTADFMKRIIVLVGCVGGSLIAFVACLPYFISLFINLPAITLILSTSLIIMLNTCVRLFQVIYINMKN